MFSYVLVFMVNYDSPGDKYEPVLLDNAYKVLMKLTVRAVGPSDFGSYKCVSKNSLGDTDGSIKLYREYIFVSYCKQLLPGLNVNYYECVRVPALVILQAYRILYVPYYIVTCGLSGCTLHLHVIS